MILQRKIMLFAAIRSNDIQTLESVLSTDAYPRLLSASDLGFHLLRKSIKHNRTQITRLLLDRGCRAESSSYTGDSPLHLLVAKRRSCYGLVKRLLDRGARVEQPNRWNDTALHAAFDASADDKVLQLLLEAHLERSVLNAANDVGLSYLHIACAAADLDCARRFVEYGGADVNAQVKLNCDSPYAGSTPLHMAVEFGKTEVIEYLLVKGASIYTPDGNGSTAIHLALELGQTDIIDLLFDYDNERLNCVNNFGVSHFMAACACSSPAIAKDFLDDQSIGGELASETVEIGSGDNAEEDVLKGFTPLHFAAIFGRFDTAKYLLADGADCCALTHNNITPAQCAAGKGYVNVADLILEHCQGHDWFLSDFSCKRDVYQRIL